MAFCYWIFAISHLNEKLMCKILILWTHLGILVHEPMVTFIRNLFIDWRYFYQLKLCPFCHLFLRNLKIISLHLTGCEKHMSTQLTSRLFSAICLLFHTVCDALCLLACMAQLCCHSLCSFLAHNKITNTYSSDKLIAMPCTAGI